jgi:hypothetical protein
MARSTYRDFCFEYVCVLYSKWFARLINRDKSVILNFYLAAEKAEAGICKFYCYYTIVKNGITQILLFSVRKRKSTKFCERNFKRIYFRFLINWSDDNSMPDDH